MSTYYTKGTPMIKNTMKINNPLTVIAVFSLLTEASAAVSLPYIDSEHQKAYVWFLIVFPSLLITLFFLTLNFNNKTLYTPADLSKAENAHEGTTCSPKPPPKQTHSSANPGLSAQLSTNPSHSGTPYNLYSPHNFFFLPRGHRIYDSDPPLLCAPENNHTTHVVKSHTLIESTALKNLHLIDLNHPHLLPPHKVTPEDVLHIYYKATRKYKNNNHKHDVLLLIINQYSTIQPQALRLAIDNFKHTAVIDHSTIISYNTDAHRLTILSSP